MPSKYDWDKVWGQARVHAPTCRSIRELADRLEMPVSTLKDRMRRDGRTPESLALGTALQANERVYTTEDGPNVRTATYEGQRIVTEEQLVQLAQVDLDVWRPEKYRVNKWEVGAKCEEKDLEWHKGVLTGTVRSTGKLTIEPLIQVRLDFVRIKPIPIYPTVQPVTIAAGTYTPPPVGSCLENGWRRHLVWSDPHFWYRLDHGRLEPLHHRGVLDVICQAAALLEVDEIDCLGDIFDLPDLSKFWKDPAVEGYWQPAILEASFWFARMASIAKLRVHEGNHDHRLDRHMATHMRAAYHIRAARQLELPPALSMPGLLALHELDAEWVGGYPKDETWLNSKLVASHGNVVRKGGGSTAAAIVKEAHESRLFGHIHRVELAMRAPQYGGHPIIACSVGCACHTDGRVPGAPYPDWQNGFAVVEYDPNGEAHNITPYVIIDNKVAINGQLLEAADRTDELKEAWPNWF